MLYSPEDVTGPSNSVSPSHGKNARVHVRMYVHTHTFFRHIHRLTSKSQASWLHSPHPSTSSAEITGKCHQFGRGGVGAGESPFQFLSIPSKLLCVCYSLPQACLHIKPKTVFTHRGPSGKQTSWVLLPKLPIMHKERIVLSKPGPRPGICPVSHHDTVKRTQGAYRQSSEFSRI